LPPTNFPVSSRHFVLGAQHHADHEFASIKPGSPTPRAGPRRPLRAIDGALPPLVVSSASGHQREQDDRLQRQRGHRQRDFQPRRHRRPLRQPDGVRMQNSITVDAADTIDASGSATKSHFTRARRRSRSPATERRAAGLTRQPPAIASACARQRSKSTANCRTTSWMSSAARQARNA